MTEAVFAEWAVKLGVTGLILYMMFIMYKLSKDSKAGRFGTAVIFFALGFGMLGFVFKEVLIAFLS